jgi:hypothetical protein
MRAAFKERSVVMLWIVIFILVVAWVGYLAFGKPKVTGEITTGVEIVKTENVQQIEMYKKYLISYAFKAQDNNKFYLKYYTYDNMTPVDERKLDLTREQYNKLLEGNKYWFEVKYSKKDDRSGSIKEIFTDDPARR